MKKKVLIFSILVFIVDLISKIVLDKVLILGKSYIVLDRFFYITKTYNYGVSFSLLSGYRWIIVIISLIILVFLFFYLKKFKSNKKNILAFSLLFGGLVGNLFDRVVYGYVIDFLDFYIFNNNFPVFNIADSSIFIGVVLLLIAIFKGEDNEVNGK